jgi:hypothetical protein
MTQHYTRNTVEAEAWCRKCSKFTMHRIDGVKLGPCLKCMAHSRTVKGVEDQRAQAEKRLAEQLEIPRKFYEDHH